MYLRAFPQKGHVGLSLAEAAPPVVGIKLGGVGGEDDTVGSLPTAEGGPVAAEGGPVAAEGGPVAAEGGPELLANCDANPPTLAEGGPVAAEGGPVGSFPFFCFFTFGVETLAVFGAVVADLL